MEYILDTHLAFWSLYESNNVPKKVKEIIEDDRNEIYISAVSIWEIATKHLINPKVMPISGTEFYHDCLNNDYLILPMLAKDVVDYENIEIKDGLYVNKDPFDRMIIALSKHQNFLLCTCDKRMQYYDDSHIMYFERSNKE